MKNANKNFRFPSASAIKIQGVSIKNFRSRFATFNDFGNFLHTLPLTFDFLCANRTAPRGERGASSPVPALGLSIIAHKNRLRYVNAGGKITSRGIQRASYFLSVIMYC